MSLLSVKNLKIHYPVTGGVFLRNLGAVKAVDDVSFEIREGETLGLVGESGCGKTTIGKGIVRLLTPQAGEIFFQGKNITRVSESVMRPLRRNIQMIFQDPSESLNSRHSVRHIIEEPLVIHEKFSKQERDAEVKKLLDRVGLPVSSIDKYPFEFSGGQRQRIGIARAIALKPKLIVCDEAVSALDVSIQAQVLNLLLELQRELKLSYLFISHNLSVVKHISDRVAVMYLGKIVEQASAVDLYRNPRHAYTQALLSAVPVHDPALRKPRKLLEGDVPSPLNPPRGSAYGHRMNHPLYETTVDQELPLREIAPQHYVTADPCSLSQEDYAIVKNA